jgi:ABC-type transport system substrate-binding protein
MRGIRPIVAALAVTIALAATACSSGSDDESSDTSEATDITTAAEGEQQEGGTLRMGLQAETSGWSPVNDQWGTSGYLVANAIFDRLAGYDEDGNIRAYLAESIEPNDDFTVWTIKLRDGVMFQDNTPVDAEAVEANLSAHQTSILTGQAFAAMDSVEVVDDLTVEVTMSKPWSTFPNVLTAQPGFMAAPSQLTDPDGSRNPVGSGPFKFVQWTQDRNLTVEANEDYWRDGYPLLDGIEYQVLTDVITRGSALESDDVDLIESDNGAQIARFEDLAEDGDYQVFLDEGGETTEWVFFVNTATAPFDNPLAREAAAAAIDREQISEVVFDGRFPPAKGPFKESSDFYADTDFVDFDLERATQAADDYEAETGEPLTFEILSPTSVSNQALVELLQQQFARAAIRAELRPVEATSGIIDVASGNFQAGTSSILWGSTHPDREYLFIHSDNVKPILELGTAFTRLSNPAIDEALDTARETDDREEQAEQWAIVQEELASDTAWMFLVHNDLAAIATPAVRDATTWTFPDGTPGLPQEQVVLQTYQIWLDD